MQRSSILERTSRFVLVVMPYLLTALIAVLILPSFLLAQAPGSKSVAVPYISNAAVADIAAGKTTSLR